MENLTIKPARPGDLDALDAFARLIGMHKEVDYFTRQLEAQQQGGRILLIGEIGGEIAAYCVLNWSPKYPMFAKLSIPEIQDLNVAPAFRRRGFATQMIAHCEGLARDKGCEDMGIGVGLVSSYGPAQRLYVKLGYVPDGQGLNYDRQPIGFGEFRPVDDDLCLMLTKPLSRS